MEATWHIRYWECFCGIQLYCVDVINQWIVYHSSSVYFCCLL